jgi:hypothetical protein
MMRRDTRRGSHGNICGSEGLYRWPESGRGPVAGIVTAAGSKSLASTTRFRSCAIVCGSVLLYASGGVSVVGTTSVLSWTVN